MIQDRESPPQKQQAPNFKLESEEDGKGLLIPFDYIDRGNHVCKLCNAIADNVTDLCGHLHSREHFSVRVISRTSSMKMLIKLCSTKFCSNQLMDHDRRPWLPDSLKKNWNKKKSPTKGVIAPFKGLVLSFLLYTSVCLPALLKYAKCCVDYVQSFTQVRNF